jgi:hypothetical protein
MRAAIALSLFMTVSVMAQHIPGPGDGDKPVNHPGCRFSTDTVIAPRGTPGATIYFSGVTIVAAYYAKEVQRPAGIAVADSNGRATFAWPPPERGIWLTVDGSTAEYTVASQAVHLLRQTDLPANALQNDPTTGELRRLAIDRMKIDVTLVRPGVGMWTGVFTDGEADADNSENGVTVADIATLTPVGNSPAAPTSLQSHDILFAVDHNAFDYFITQRP